MKVFTSTWKLCRNKYSLLRTGHFLWVVSCLVLELHEKLFKFLSRITTFFPLTWLNVTRDEELLFFSLLTLLVIA